MLTILINLAVLALIGATYWFFFRKKEEDVVEAGSRILITVDGGYKPAHIRLARGKTTTLAFFRKDPSSCLEEVTIPDFKIRQTLPLNQTTEIVVTPQKTGVFDLHCGMNMYHGKLEVM